MNLTIRRDNMGGLWLVVEGRYEIPLATAKLVSKNFGERFLKVEIPLTEAAFPITLTRLDEAMRGNEETS